MAAFTVNDAICHDTYRDAFRQQQPNCCTALWSSGLVASSPLIGDAASGAGKLTHFPYFKPLDHSTEAQVPELAGACVCDGAEMDEEVARKQRRSKCWSWDYLTSLCLSKTDADTVNALFTNTVEWWMKEYEGVATASLLGVLAGNIANDGGDMLFDAVADANFPDNRLNEEVILAAFQQLGCAAGELDGIIVHFDIFWKLASASYHLNPMTVESVQSTNGQQVTRGTFMGLKIICSCNDLLKDTTGANPVYTSILFRDGAVAYGEGYHPAPQYADEDHCANGGDGAAQYGERHQYIIHPIGFRWLEPAALTNPNAMSPQNIDLMGGGNWQRASNRDQVALSFVQTEM